MRNSDQRNRDSTDGRSHSTECTGLRDSVTIKVHPMLNGSPGGVFVGAVLANDDVGLSVRAGTVHGIVGENGAGKSTLMSVLYGFYTADSGMIEVFGQPAQIRNAHEAIALGIGMVHQHFTLALNLTGFVTSCWAPSRCCACAASRLAQAGPLRRQWRQHTFKRQPLLQERTCPAHHPPATTQPPPPAAT